MRPRPSDRGNITVLSGPGEMWVERWRYAGTLAHESEFLEKIEKR